MKKLNLFRKQLGEKGGKIGSSVLVLAILLLVLFSVSSCSQKKKEQQVVSTPQTTVQAPAQTPAVKEVKKPSAEPAPAPQVVTPEPKKEEKVAEVVPQPAPQVVENPDVSASRFYFGYPATVTLSDGKGYISYAGNVQASDISAFVNAAKAAYPEVLAHVRYQIEGPHALTLAYPQGFSKQERADAIDTAFAGLDSYIASLATAKEPKVEATPVKEEKKASATPEVKPLVQRKLNCGSEVIAIDAYDGFASVRCPKTITYNDVDAAAYALAKAHPEVIGAARYTQFKDGTIIVDYARGYDKAFLDGTISELQILINGYVASLAAPEKPLTVRSLPIYGSAIEIAAYDGHATLEYPEWVSDDYLIEVQKALVGKYPEYASQITVTGVKSGRIDLGYPEGLSKKDLDGAIDTLNSDLGWYLASLEKKPAESTVVAAGNEKSSASLVIVAEKKEPEKKEAAKPAEVAKPASEPVSQKTAPKYATTLAFGIGGEFGFNPIDTEDVGGFVINGSLGLENMTSWTNGFGVGMQFDGRLSFAFNSVHGVGNFEDLFQKTTYYKYFSADALLTLSYTKDRFNMLFGFGPRMVVSSMFKYHRFDIGSHTLGVDLGVELMSKFSYQLTSSMSLGLDLRYDYLVDNPSSKLDAMVSVGWKF